MSDRQLGPDEPVAQDDPALPPEVWDSLFWACVLPSDDEGPLALPAHRTLALPPAEDQPPPPTPEQVPVEVVARPVAQAATRPAPRREVLRGLRSSAGFRAAVVTLVLGSAVLIATLSDGDGPRSDLVRSGAPATMRPAQPDTPVTTAPMPVLQEPTESTAPAAEVTSTTAAPTTAAPTTAAPTTAAPVATIRTPAAPRTTQARTSRPPPTAAPTRQAPPATTAPAFDPACGFAPGSSVDVNLNGKPLGVYTADVKGCVHVPAQR